MVFLIIGWSAENIEEKKKTDRRKPLKSEKKENEEYEENQITTLYIFGVLSYNLLENIIWKKVVNIIKFYLQFLCVAGYLKHSNDTPNLNRHKYTNYNIIEIYTNRSSTTTQIFIAILITW